MDSKSYLFKNRKSKKANKKKSVHAAKAKSGLRKNKSLRISNTKFFSELPIFFLSHSKLIVRHGIFFCFLQEDIFVKPVALMTTVYHLSERETTRCSFYRITHAESTWNLLRLSMHSRVDSKTQLPFKLVNILRIF